MNELMAQKIADLKDKNGYKCHVVTKSFDGCTMEVTVYAKPNQTVEVKKYIYIAGADGEIYEKEYEEES